MRFESRELKPYGEPVSASELKEGSVYFFLQFIDDEMLIPTLEPVVFVGRNLEPGDAGRVYFQDIGSHRHGVTYNSAAKDDEATFYTGSESELGHVFEYERALDGLMRCSLKRQKTQGLSPAHPRNRYPMIRNPRYVIAVHDLERSARYYRDVLGFEVREIGDPGWRFFMRDQCWILAGECPDALPPQDLGDHSYFAYLEVDDIDALYEEVTAKGATVTKKLRDEPWGMREFGLRTVDGHRIMFGRLIPKSG